MKSLFSILIISLAWFVNIHAQATIHSTTIGGNWHESTTWIEGIVPGTLDNVVIQGPVFQHYVTGYDIHPVYCNNLTITGSGSLINGGYGGGAGTFPVYVAGNVVNNGIVANGSEDYLKMFIAGDIENNNTWMPYETEFQISENHNLSLAEGKSFGSKIINNNSMLTALSDLYFTCDWNSGGNMYRDHFYLNGQTLVLGNHSIELYPTCLINKGKLLGDFEILGTFTTGWTEGYDIRDTLVFEGNITITDTLKGNVYGGGYGIYKLKVMGNIINNGVIMDDYDTDAPLNNDDLNILVTGNIYNNGIWNCNFVTLIGSETQYINQNLYKQFDSYFTDNNASSKVQAQSYIVVTKDFNLNGATLDMDNYRLTIGGLLHNGFINNTNLENGYLQNITSTGNLVIEGTVTIDDNNIFQGTVTVYDTLQSNEYGGGSKVFSLPVHGNITNNGVIKNFNSGDKLSLEITGDIFNSGVWENSFTKLTGSQDQFINQAYGRKFVTEISDLDSTSKLIATSNLTIEGDCNLNRSTLQMDSNEINVSGSIHNGFLKSPIIKNAKLSSVTVYDGAEIRGIVQIDDGNIFFGNLLVTDTLQSIPYGGGAHTYSLNVYGDLMNFGVIRDEPNQGENFAVYVKGDIVNHGSFSNYRVYQTYFQNNNSNSIQCYNTGSSDWIFSGVSITENESNAFSIIAGGGTQTVQPNQSYDLTIQYTPTTGDSTATLNINCTEIGSLSTIYLIGYNYNQPVDVEEDINTIHPTEFVLNQNFPNPFNPGTMISWQSPVSSWQTIKMFNSLGQEVETIVDGYYEAGVHSKLYIVNSSLPSGVYYYQLKAGSFMETKKMILLK